MPSKFDETKLAMKNVTNSLQKDMGLRFEQMCCDVNMRTISDAIDVEAAEVLITAQRSARKGHQLLQEICKQQQPFLAFFGLAKLRGPAYELYKLLLDQERFLAAEDTVDWQIPQHHQGESLTQILHISALQASQL